MECELVKLEKLKMKIHMKKEKSLLMRLFFLVIILGLHCSVLAQKRTITGIVNDTKNEPIVGAIVQIKGTSVNAMTKFDGTFSLDSPTNAQFIMVSYLGMKSRTVQISKNYMSITLAEASMALNELVVVGYGTMKKKDETGSTSSINSSRIAGSRSINALNSLQGSVSGVQVQQISSRAGTGYDITIRGRNSISGSTAPLYVVDGIVTPNLDFLSPQDIERMDVMKDASSIAIWGSRGSHGVINVQTKSGVTLQPTAAPSISFDSYVGVSTIARMPHFMDARESMKYRALNLQYTSDMNNDGVIEFNTADLRNLWFGGAELNNLNDGKGYQPVYSNGNWSGSQFLLDRYLSNSTTNWVNLVTQTGTQQNYSLKVAGNTKIVSYALGLGYQKEKGVLDNDTYQRYNFNGTFTANIAPKLTGGFVFRVSYSDQEAGSDNAILNSFRLNAIITPYTNGNLDPTMNHLVGNLIVLPGRTTEAVTDINGVPTYNNSIGSSGFTSVINPLIDLENTTNETRKITGLGNIFLQYEPFKGFSIKTTISPYISISRKGVYKSTLTEGNYDNPLTTAIENNAKAEIESATFSSYTIDNLVNYKFTLKEDHSFDLMALQSINTDNAEIYSVKTSGYDIESLWYNFGAATNTIDTKVASAYNQSSLSSLAFRINYSYKGKYLISIANRTDASSKFAINHKWMSFPAISVGWNVSDEPFMQSLYNQISNLKFRASYGITGNNGINPYLSQLLASQTTYYNFGGSDAIGIAPGPLASKTLTWETTSEMNLGLDLSLFRNRIEMSFDAYHRISTNLLQNRTLPLEMGSDKMVDNLGSVLNAGYEFSLTSNLIDQKDLKWTLSGTYSWNMNKLMNLFGNTTPGYVFINNSQEKWMVGESVNSIYGYVYDGVWTADGILDAIKNKDPRVVKSDGTVIAREGQAKIKDFDGDGINSNDRRIQGHSNPTWMAGLITRVSYKEFDFAVNIYTAQGMTVFSPFIEEFTNFNDRGSQKLVMDYYIPAGTRMVGDDGYFYTQQTAHNYQGRPMPYTDNGSKSNSGPYWHSTRDIANEMPGAWVDASYIKVKNVTLGYTLSNRALKYLKVSKLRLYANVTNPFVISNYKGFDPEWAGASMAKDNGPSTITYQLGVSVSL